MSELVLDSLLIENFRAFRHLEIERLGRVNLITGKNNVGKTSLLEALWIYARRASPAIVRSLLVDRDEWSYQTSYLGNRDEPQIDYEKTYAAMLYGRQLKSLKISAIGSETNRLEITPDRFLEWGGDADQNLTTRYVRDVNGELFLQIQIDGYPVQMERLDLYFDRPMRHSRFFESKSFPSEMVGTSGLLAYRWVEMWGKTALTPLETEVLRALQIISPDVERVNIVEASLGDRQTLLKFFGDDNPVPIKVLGEGMNRLFGIALALVNSRDGFLLVDEIENGLHYSVQTDIWKFIFEVAERFNVQVFATTHSWECIDAFQSAANASEAEGVLIRLENKEGQIVDSVLDERKVEIATRLGIEVR